jgi:predicted O-methyltransferase YrrM
MKSQALGVARKIFRVARETRFPTVLSAVRTEKQSENHQLVFNDVLAEIEQLHKRELLPALEPVNQRRQQLIEMLTSQIRETSYQHVVQKMDAGEVFRAVSSPPVGLNLIYICSKHAPPGWRVELGSAFGLGTRALCIAERETENPVDGIEYEQWRAEIATEGAREVLGERATVHAGKIEDQFPALSTKRQGLGFAFIDAMHTYEATIGYHRLLREQALPGAFALYDDLPWSKGMERAWAEIVADDAVSDAIRIDRRWGLVCYNASQRP